MFSPDNFTYRSLSQDKAEKYLKYAEEHNLDYQIWNIEDLLMDTTGEICVELGFKEWPDVNF